MENKACWAEDRKLFPSDLEEKYAGKNWNGEHPIYTRAQWREDVAQENVISGYWDMVFNTLQEGECDA